MVGIPKCGQREGVLFHLVPLTGNTEVLFEDRKNKHLQARIQGDRENLTVLELGHIQSHDGPGTLASLGRSADADIFLNSQVLSRIHAVFEINPNTGVVMFRDTSSDRSTRLSGRPKCDFPQIPDPRRVVVLPNINTEVALGPRGGIRFRIVWRYAEPREALFWAKQLRPLPLDITLRPPHGPYTDVTPSNVRADPDDATTVWDVDLKWTSVEEIGSGGFGVVHKGVNNHTGQLIAVKELRNWAARESVTHDPRRTEVEILSNLDHPHIVEFLGSSGWARGGPAYIFMDLKQGSLESMLNRVPGISGRVGNAILCQMLQALEYLSQQEIVHRDVKPSNILCTFDTTSKIPFHFFLTDFGLANREGSAINTRATPLFRAPESFGSGPKTHKVDIWALFVTMLEVYDVDGWRNMSGRRHMEPNPRHHAIRLVTQIADKKETEGKRPNPVWSFRKMVDLNPDNRFSASECLDAWFRPVPQYFPHPARLTALRPLRDGEEGEE